VFPGNKAYFAKKEADPAQMQCLTAQRADVAMQR